jgi:hypothetical protein
MENFDKVFTNHKIEKKKKREKRKNTENICIWYYQVQILALTKAASILVPSYKRFGFACNQ